MERAVVQRTRAAAARAVTRARVAAGRAVTLTREAAGRALVRYGIATGGGSASQERLHREQQPSGTWCDAAHIVLLHGAAAW